MKTQVFLLFALCCSSLSDNLSQDQSTRNQTDNEDLLFCRCGLDHSDPFHDYANTKCHVIQYHEKVKGVQGNFSGITIANETHCQIDRKQNPNGMCRKQVTAHQKNDALASSSKKHDHIEITWGCKTIESTNDIPTTLCNSRPDVDVVCCWDENNCNDRSRTPIEEAFYKDRKMKRTQRYLYVALIVIILILITVFCMYRKYPDLVKQLFGKCCKQVSSNFSTGARYNQHGAHMPIMDPALRDGTDITNAGSTGVTFITDPPDDSGSGQGNTICTQRTIARQTRIVDRVGNGRYGTVFRAIYNSDHVAVKKFYSKEEASWQREVTFYQSQSLAHENILRFIAADNRDNGTQTELWLIMDYHERGSLFDYLVENTLTPELCIKMAHSIASGVEHLHKEIQGTLTKKFAIAHRDIKSKNILVKSNLELCIADLGLACFCGSNQTLVPTSNFRSGISGSSGIDSGMYVSSKNPVGTVRYLAPEYLKTELFNEYLNLTRADIYSSALVFWELLNRTKGYYGVRKDALNNPAFEEIPEYRQPYWDSVPAEPKIEDMAAVVTADPPQRPFVPNHYTHRRFWNPVQGFIEPNQTKPNNIIIELESPEPYVLSELSVLVQLMKECWQERPSARLSALRLKKDLRELKQNINS